MDPKMMADDMTMQSEPGATDNQLTLGVDGNEFIKDWEDGNSYTLTVEVTQVAPGQFRVDKAVPEDQGENEGPAPDEAAGYEEPTNSGDYAENPAVAKMLAKR